MVISALVAYGQHIVIRHTTFDNGTAKYVFWSTYNARVVSDFF